MDDHNPADKDFLGCRLGTNCARINALLPGPDERPIRKIELAKRAGIPTREDPSSAHVSHLESFVKGDRECRLLPEEPGLIEKLRKREGVRGAYFRLTPAGADAKENHAARHSLLVPTIPSANTHPAQPKHSKGIESTPALSQDTHSAKQDKYDQLVLSRKSCDICQGLVNPSRIKDGSFDSTEIGPWSRWQGNLDSEVMLVAQDWGYVGNFEKQKGTDSNSETNKTLKKLLQIAGITVRLPLDKADGRLLFCTNAILCLKKGSDQAPVKSDWYRNCGPRFLKPLMEIVKPKVVICIGQRAYDTVMTCYGRKPEPFRHAGDKHVPAILSSGMAVFAVYHCGSRIRNTHRKGHQQEDDWKQIGIWLKEHKLG